MPDISKYSINVNYYLTENTNASEIYTSYISFSIFFF